MIASVLAARTFVLTAVALLLATACTRVNPEFSDDRAEGGKTTKPGEDDDIGDDDVADDDSAEDDATTFATTFEDVGPSGTGIGSDDGATTSTQGTTGADECALSQPVHFDVSAFDSNGASIPAVCGDTFSWQGAVSTTATPHELVLLDCGGSCSCDGEGATVLLSFSALAPSPADLLEGSEMDCFSITVARRPRGENCMVEWILVESISSSADYPSFMATSSADPGWSLSVPPAILGDPIDDCPSDVCQPPLPGEYQMFLDGNGPIDPGTSLPVDLNPYAGVGATYDVTNLYAQVDGGCATRLAWAAIVQN